MPTHQCQFGWLVIPRGVRIKDGGVVGIETNGVGYEEDEDYEDEREVLGQYAEKNPVRKVATRL